MPLSNDIALRPKFKMEIPKFKEAILSDFENAKRTQSEFVITRVDNNVFIKFPKDNHLFLSPQLHLKIIKVDKNSSMLHGLFGPNATVWTLFIIVHFLVGGLFIAFAIWTYINWSLNQSYAVQASVTLLMILLWVTLYFGGSISKATTTKDMRLLNNFMNNILTKEKENQD